MTLRMKTREALARIFHTLGDKTRLSIIYRTPAGDGSKRQIDPLKLVNYQGRWYILAWCCLRQSRRMFHMARITTTQPTDTKTEHVLEPGDDWLTGSFGIFKGDAATRFTAELLFKGTAADIIRCQRWHPDQEISKTAEGVILKLPVADDRELIMKVLQFGHQARIIHPKSLQGKISNEIEKMAAMYETNGK